MGFDTPFDPTGTKWDVFKFEDDKEVEDNSDGAVWEFHNDKRMHDRDKWVGKWEPLPGNNDRIITFITTSGETKYSIYEIVFLNINRFIVLLNNQIIRFGRRNPYEPIP